MTLLTTDPKNRRRSGPTAALLGALLAGIALGAQAQVLPDWSASTPASTGVALALDGANNSLAATSAANGAITVAKRGPAGQLLWQHSLASAGPLSRATSVVADAAGHSVVTGYRVDATGAPLGPVVARLDGAGNLLWQDLPAAAGHAWRAAVDATGNVYVLSREARAGTTPVVMDMLLTRYSSAGVRLWTRSFGARYSASDTPLVVSPAGMAVVTGTGDLGGQELLAAFDPAGNLLMAKAIASTGPLGLALGRGGELVAVGAAPAGAGFLVVKHDAAFNELWRNSYPARGPAQRAAVDAAGNLLVSGVTDANTGMLAVVLYDWLTLKLDANGALLWQHQLGTASADDVPAGLALGADGAAYLTGKGSLATTTSTGSTVPLRSTVTLKLGPDGAPRWLANTTTSLRGVALQLGGDGGVVVLGDSTQLSPADGTAVVLRYPQSGLPNLAPVARASASPALGTAPLTVAFSATGSSDVDGLIASHRWDFGDGQSATVANPSHTYAAGSYTARLTVTDTLGASAVSAPLAISANTVALPPARPTAIVLAATRVLGGTATTATVSLSSAAGATVRLASSNTTVARVPASVVVPAGATAASFTITTAAVRKTTTVTLRASANGKTAQVVLTVVPR